MGANEGGAVAQSLAALLLVAAAATPDTLANGGILKLDRAPIGPYVVSAWIDPDPPRPGALDLSVAVMKPPAGDAVLDEEVTGRAEPANGSGPSSSLTLRRGAGGNLLLYHGEADLPTPGRWRITVILPRLPGPREASFEVDVRRRPVPAWAIIAAGALGLLLTVALRRRRRLGGT